MQNYFYYFLYSCAPPALAEGSQGIMCLLGDYGNAMVKSSST